MRWTPILLLILLLGFFLRLHPLDWDNLLLTHPDERYVAQVAASIDPFASQSWNPFWQSDSEESRLFAYGQWPLYMITAWGRLCCDHSLWTPEQQMAVAGRFLAATWGTLAVGFTLLLGKRLFGVGAGLLAAVFLAVAPLHVQVGHFGTFDTAQTALTTAALWLLVRYAQTRRPRDSLFAGTATGLAIGAKFTVIFLPVVLAVVCWRDWRRSRGWTALKPLFVAGMVFILSNPFAILEPILWGKGILTQGYMVRGIFPPGDFEYVRQFSGTSPWLYFVEQQARFSLGLPLTTLGYVGLVWATWRVWKAPHARWPLGVAILWCWCFFGMVGSQHVKFSRYMMPLHPPLLVLAAGMLVSLWHSKRVLAAVLSGGAWLWSMTLSVALLASYAAPHPWAAASDWLYQQIPPESVLLLEEWDESLPTPRIVNGTVYLSDTFVRLQFNAWQDPDDQEKLAHLADQLIVADYVILASGRVYAAVPRLPARYPLTIAYYKALFDQALGFELVAVFDRGPVPFSPLDESLTVYDRPQVLIWRNIERLDAVVLIARISEYSGP